MKRTQRSFLPTVGVVLIGVGLALLLPTPVFLAVAGGWLARHGWQQRKRQDKT